LVKLIVKEEVVVVVVISRLKLKQSEIVEMTNTLQKTTIIWNGLMTSEGGISRNHL